MRTNDDDDNDDDNDSGGDNDAEGENYYDVHNNNDENESVNLRCKIKKVATFLGCHSDD